MEPKDSYFIAVKVFLEHAGRLLILKDNFGDWDLPGGRLKKDEFHAPLEQIVARKMTEELGDRIQYTVSQPVVFMRHERQEAVEGNPTVRIFAIGYAGILEQGEIVLSPRHVKMKWVDIPTFQPDKYFTGGWLKGVEDYLKIARDSAIQKR